MDVIFLVVNIKSYFFYTPATRDLTQFCVKYKPSSVHLRFVLRVYSYLWWFPKLQLQLFYCFLHCSDFINVPFLFCVTFFIMCFSLALFNKKNSMLCHFVSHSSRFFLLSNRSHYFSFSSFWFII